MRVRHQLIVSVTDDPAGEEGEFTRSGNLPLISSDAFDSNACGRFFAPADGTPVSLSLGDVEQGAGCYVEGTGTFLLTVNGSDTAFTLESIQFGAKAKFFLEGTVTSLTVQAATVGISVGGAYTVWGNTPSVPE